MLLHSFVYHLFFERSEYMADKIITEDEYKDLLAEDKKFRNKLFDLRYEIALNSRNEEKCNLLLEKVKVLKKSWARTKCLIYEYERDNNIKKERGKK